MSTEREEDASMDVDEHTEQLNDMDLKDIQIFAEIEDLANQHPGQPANDMTNYKGTLTTVSVAQPKALCSEFEVTFGADGYPEIAQMGPPPPDTETDMDNEPVILCGKAKTEDFTKSAKKRAGTGHYVIDKMRYTFTSDATKREILVDLKQFDEGECAVDVLLEGKKACYRLKFLIKGQYYAVTFKSPPNVFAGQTTFAKHIKSNEDPQETQESTSIKITFPPK